MLPSCLGTWVYSSTEIQVAGCKSLGTWVRDSNSVSRSAAEASNLAWTKSFAMSQHEFGHFSTPESYQALIFLPCQGKWRSNICPTNTALLSRWFSLCPRWDMLISSLDGKYTLTNWTKTKDYINPCHENLPSQSSLNFHWKTTNQRLGWRVHSIGLWWRRLGTTKHCSLRTDVSRGNANPDGKPPLAAAADRRVWCPPKWELRKQKLLSPNFGIQNFKKNLLRNKHMVFFVGNVFGTNKNSSQSLSASGLWCWGRTTRRSVAHPASMTNTSPLSPSRWS